MPEAEWLAFGTPDIMLAAVWERIRGRKAWWLSAECVYRIRRRSTPVPIRRIVSLCEALAEGTTDIEASLRLAPQEILAGRPSPWDSLPRFHLATGAATIATAVDSETFASGLARLATAVAYRAAPYAVMKASGEPDDPLWQQSRRDEETVQCHLIRCVSVPPHLPATFDPDWRTSTVHALASTIYAELDFDLLPILADALQDAGCECADILDHCRGPGPHVRGCWVVDLVLGKS